MRSEDRIRRDADASVAGVVSGGWKARNAGETGDTLLADIESEAYWDPLAPPQMKTGDSDNPDAGTYNLLLERVGKPVLHAFAESVAAGEISYTDALRLTGIRLETWNRLVAKLKTEEGTRR